MGCPTLWISAWRPPGSSSSTPSHRKASMSFAPRLTVAKGVPTGALQGMVHDRGGSCSVGARPRRGTRRGRAPTLQTHTVTLSISYTHLRAHETRHDLVCRLLLEKK